MADYKEAENESYDDAKIVSCSRLTKKGNKDLSAHIILNIGIVPASANPADHAIYYATEPFWLGVGNEYDFWNNETRSWESRKVTVEITNEKLEEFLKKVPAAANCADAKDALAWLLSDASHGAQCRAKFINKPGTDENGAPTTYHNAYLYEVKRVAESAEDIMSSFSKQMSVCRVKFGGKKATPTAPTAPKAPNVPTKPNAPMPPAPANKSEKTSSQDEVWAFYEKCLLKTDPNGEKFWSRVAEVVGKDEADCASLSPTEWGKVMAHFVDASLPF